MYVTDLDGTLLTPEGCVSDRSARMITDLTRQGALITVATARTPATVELLLTDTHTVLPAIVMTGATLWNRSTMSYTDTSFLDPITADDIAGRFARHGVAPFVYTLDDNKLLKVYHNGEMNEKERDFVAIRRSLALKQFIIDDPKGLGASLSEAIMFFAMGDRERVFALADDLRENVDCSVSNYVDIFGADTGILEVFAPRISKAEAVKRLAKSVNANRIVVFGDNLNDIPMLQVADTAVAVGNALPEVKDVADVVIGDNTTDAVARYIAEDFN